MNQKLPIYFAVSKAGTSWNSTAAMFVERRHRTLYTSLTEARAVAKAQKGHIERVSRPIMMIERQGTRIYDIIEVMPTDSGNVPPLLVDAIARALARDNRVELYAKPEEE